MKTNNKGFSIIEVIIALLIVITIAGAGWYVYQRTQNEESTANSTQQSVSSSDESSSEEYIEIEEWGVRMKLPEGSQGYTYKAATDSPEKGTSSVSIYSNEFNAKTNADGVSCGDEPDSIGSVIRVDFDEYTYNPSEPYSFKQDDESRVDIGDYSYFYINAHQSVPMCAVVEESDQNPNEQDEKLASEHFEIGKAFIDIFETTQSVN